MLTPKSLLRRLFMSNYDKDSDLQLNQILQIVKIASLFFSAIAFYQYYFSGKDVYLLLANDGLVFFSVLLIVLIVYVLWSIFQNRMKNNNFSMTWIEPSIFFIIAFSSIMLTGNFKSDYKFLFLFVIISSSIECGMKTGLVLASISSSVILAIDLIFAHGTAVNTYFESDLVLVACNI
jgi:hypothetical protein